MRKKCYLLVLFCLFGCSDSGTSSEDAGSKDVIAAETGGTDANSTESSTNATNPVETNSTDSNATDLGNTESTTTESNTTNTNTSNTNSTEATGGDSTDTPPQTVTDALNNATVRPGESDNSLIVTGSPATNLPGANVTADPEPNTAITQLGYVNLEIENLEFTASFQALDQSARYSELIGTFKPIGDSCEVTNAPRFGIGSFPGTSVLLTEGISAGEVLTISSSSGSYTELLRSERQNFIFYGLENDDALAAPIPDDLDISIPGDTFPSFLKIPFQNIDNLIVNSPKENEEVTANTAFTWNAGSNPLSFIEISAFFSDVLRTTSVDCLVVDDGSFNFPSDVRSEIGDLSGGSFLSREAVSVRVSGSSLLVVSTSSEP